MNKYIVVQKWCLIALPLAFLIIGLFGGSFLQDESLIQENIALHKIIENSDKGDCK